MFDYVWRSAAFGCAALLSPLMAHAAPAEMVITDELATSHWTTGTAYIAGMEIATRLGSVAKGGFHQTGFHPTGLVGIFATTLIAGRMRDLTEDQMTSAQGIALSLASGSLEFLQDGAWTKRIHPGIAGAQGITATALARNGFIGPKAVYEGRFGLFVSHLGALFADCDLSLATKALGSQWEVTKVAVKPLPACHFTHASADAAVLLRDQHGLTPDMIDHVRALIPEVVVKTVDAFGGKVPSAPVYDVAQALDSPYVSDQNLIVELSHPVRGKIKTLACPIRCRGEAVPARAAPRLGADTQDILDSLERPDTRRVAQG